MHFLIDYYLHHPSAYLIARPSPQMAKLDIDKREAQVEVAKIKSVQLEFVKHSLLQRKVISIEKKMELLQLQYNPRLQAVRKVFRVLRVSFLMRTAN
jgi:hypothetical protein